MPCMHVYYYNYRLSDICMIPSCSIQNDIIVTGCSDSVVRVYDVHSGQCLKYAETLVSIGNAKFISYSDNNYKYKGS